MTSPHRMQDVWETWLAEQQQQEVADMKIFNGSDPYLFPDDPIPDPIPRRRRLRLPDWALHCIIGVITALAVAIVMLVRA